MVDKTLKEAEERMDKTVEVLLEQFVSVHNVGTGFIETIKVEYYGSSTPLAHLAQISLPHPGKIMIRPHDQGILKDIERAISGANLGVNVSKEKDKVWVSVPMLSMERREKMVKHLSKLAEDAKVAIRNIRRDAKKIIDKSDIPEDDAIRGNKKLQELTDSHIEKVGKLFDKKSKVIME